MFNFEDVAQSQERQSGVVAPGVYKASVTDLEFKAANKGGSFWKVTIQTTEGKVWMNFTHENPSEVAQRIGREGMADLIFALGVPPKFESVEVLASRVVNKEIVVEVSNEDEGDGKLRALIAASYKLDGSHRAGEKRNLNPIVLGPNGKKPFKGKKANAPTTTANPNSNGDLPF